jgi:hypothetical protein
VYPRGPLSYETDSRSLAHSQVVMGRSRTIRSERTNPEAKRRELIPKTELIFFFKHRTKISRHVNKIYKTNKASSPRDLTLIESKTFSLIQSMRAGSNRVGMAHG